MRLSSVSLILLVTGGSLFAQTPGPGRVVFERRCARCHGADGNGAEMGPSILSRLGGRDDAGLAALIRDGLPSRGMPPQSIAQPELGSLVAFLRTIERRPEAQPLARREVSTTDGKTVAGQVLGEGFDDLQLRTDDRRIRLLRRAGDRYRPVTSQVDWPTYNGDPGGNRYTSMTQIDKTNVGRLAPKWVFTVPGAGRLQGTPVVTGGIMYLPSGDECYALDAGTGRQVWQYARPRTGEGGRRSGSGATNRGVAVAGDRLFMVAPRAYLVALDRFTGEKLWETEVADPRQNYFTTSAPLTAGKLVVTGVGGGEDGANGFVAAFDQATGKEVWRFSTVPKPGEPGSETWQGKDIEHGGAPTWFTGSYDRELDLVYWPTGNPAKEYNGDDRKGDNLYSDCILALDAATGKLRWHYQFTPHDLWDWDSTETSVLIDAPWQGRPRKLMIHADRNGFLYVFDRATGELLLAKAFVRNLTWASGIGPDGRPIKQPNQEPTAAGTRVCPSQDGATNWFSPSYSPLTGLYYVQTFEKCSVYMKRDGDVWESGKSYLGGSQRTSLVDPKPARILKAIDIRTGAIVWELPQPGPAESWGGTLATATGLVFVCEESGAFMALDAASGKPLWSFPANVLWKASPMAYMFDGKQHLAVVAGPSILTFALPGR